MATLVIFGASLGNEPFADEEVACSHLTSLLLGETAHYSIDVLEMAALESNETCIDAVWPVRERGIPKLYVLGRVLEVIGGPVAVARLQGLRSVGNDEYLKCIIDSAMVSTGTTDDIRHLLDSLHSDTMGGPLDQSPDCAAFALSVLRPTEALPEVLNALAANPDSPELINLARVFKEGELTAPQAGTLAVEDEVVLAVLKSNPPGTKKNILLRDPLRQRVYRRSGSNWYVKRSRVWDPGDQTRAAFRVRLSKDENRALVDLFYAYASYSYILGRQNGQWRVRGASIGPVN